ncbi:MAG: Na+/H+ antiporter NhaC family protein [Ruthenibacterium sp.]
MDAVYAGWLSILPPFLAIVLAFITKDVIFSLVLGALSGTVIYSVMAGLNSFVAPVENLFNVAVANIDVYIIFFCCLLGALVQVVAIAGGSKAYGQWASQRLRSKRSSLLATSILGCVIFIDDYFNCLTVGTVMKPVTDRYKVSRAKLAYIIDSTAAPICIIAPVSSWAAAVSSNLRTTGAFTSDFAAFCSTIPYNLYALLTITMVLIVSVKSLDFGPMAHLEAHAAKTGELGAVETDEAGMPGNSKNGRVSDMLAPICALILFAILGMLYNGGFWSAGSETFHSFVAALGNCSASQALCWGGFGALVVAFLLFVPRRLMSFKEFMNGFYEGMKAMVPAACILILAWTISGVCRDLLQTAVFVRDVMAASSIPMGLLPAIIFIVAAFLSFSTGTAWGTFGILIPIIVPVAAVLSPNLLIVSLSATLGGSVFGDHCSPISDTTILSSTGAGCDHLQHVATQMPYAILVAVCCIIGYLVAGFTDGNLLLTLLSSFGCLIVAVNVLHRYTLKKEEKLASNPTES